MADLKGQEIRNAYDELLTKGAGNTVEDGDGVPFDIFNRAFTAGGLVRLPSGINFNASGGDTLSDYEVGTWTPSYDATGGFESITYGTARIGRYVRVGQLCFIVCHLRTTELDKTGSSGFFVVQGLPFNGASSTNQSIALNRARGFIKNPQTALVFQNEIYFEFRDTSTGPTVLLQMGEVSDTTASNQNLIQLAGVYEIA